MSARARKVHLAVEVERPAEAAFTAASGESITVIWPSYWGTVTEYQPICGAPPKAGPAPKGSRVTCKRCRRKKR